MTALQHAVMRNHVPTVKVLIERGADMEKKNKEGYSPLALALAEAKFEVAKALSTRARTSTPSPDRRS